MEKKENEKIDAVLGKRDIPEVEKKELLKQSEISLMLDTYDDIFSDFDPRPYSERALSDDFLIEAKKASRDKTTGIELKFLIPKTERNLINEILIKRRLREHFKKHVSSLLAERGKIRRQGLLFCFIGTILMLTASFLFFKSLEKSFITSFLITLLEPASWFLFWEGLNQAIFESRKSSSDLDFYRKMSKCDINFYAY